MLDGLLNLCGAHQKLLAQLFTSLLASAFLIETLLIFTQHPRGQSDGKLYNTFDQKYKPWDNQTALDLNSDEITLMMATTHYQDDLTTIPFLSSMENCPKRCRLVSVKTSPRELLTANALIFHLVWTDIDLRWFRWLTQRRDPKQIFIFYSMEPPLILADLLPRRMHDYRIFNNRFNWTMNYRHDSDVFVPYGISGYEEIPLEIAYNKPPRDRVKVKGKKHIAAVISNCQSRNYDRIGVLKELQSLGLEVDIFGACGTKTCPGRAGDECYRRLEKEYLFYASFENSLCPDYVTEKLFNILDYDMVPIVIGNANYSSFIPPHSYINMHEFQSAVSFASFIKRLARDEDEYNSYHTWKMKHQIKHYNHHMYCAACMELHEHRVDPYKSRYYRDLDGWWRLQCNSKGEIFNGLR